MKMDKKCVNCTLVGDGMVGKTTLAQTFAGLEMEDNYIATVFENYAGSVSVAGERYTISIYDTAGQHDYSNMRAFTYKDSEVFLLCYSVGDRESFNSIKSFWLPEIKKFMGKKCPIILVANQVDTRDADIEVSISKEEGLCLAKDINADGFVEVASVLHDGISTTFEKVVMTALKYRKKKSKILQKLLGR